MSVRTRGLQTEPLEDRRVLSVNPVMVTDQLISVQSVSTGSLAVTMDLSDFTSAGSDGTNTAPQATGVAAFQINSGTQYSVSLPSAFSDAETAATDLIFSVLDNTQGNVFKDVSIDSDGNLILDFVPGVSGTTDLTIQADDGNGGVASLRVGITGLTNEEILAINNFTGHRDPDDPDTWTFSGQVTGANDDSDVTVEFGGDLSGSTTTDTNGNFTFTGTIDHNENPTGQVTAQAHSGNGSSSSMVIFDLDDE